MIEFVSCHKPSEILQPADGSFDFPSFAVTFELSAVLGCWFHAISFVGRNQVDAAFEKTQPQRVTVSCKIVDQLLRSPTKNPILNQRFNQIDFMRAGTFNHVSVRQAIAVNQQHDLGSLAPLGLAYAKAPFFAGANVPSAMDSSRSTLPSRSRRLTRRAHAFLNRPDTDHFLSRRQQVGWDGKCLGKSRHRAPVRKTHTMASKHDREEARGRPPSGDGGGSSNKSEIKPHCSSVSSKLGSILDPMLSFASAEWDRCDISLFPFGKLYALDRKWFDPIFKF